MTTDNLTSVRAFVRNFNVVVKQVNLYGLSHKQVVPQLQNTWKELQGGLASGKLMLTSGGDRLLASGKPVGAGSADKSLAQILTMAGIAGICLHPELTFEEFGRLVRTFAVTKPQDLLATMKKEFGGRSRVRVLEFQIAGDEPAHQGLSLTGQVAAAMLGGSAAETADVAPATTNELLRVLACMVGNATGAEENSAVAQKTEAMGEDDVTQTIRWLAKLGLSGADATVENTAPVTELSPVAQEELRKALAAPASELMDPNAPVLVPLAEQLAVKVALDKYQRGELPLSATQQMLNRLKREIEKLQCEVRAQEDVMFRAGVESPREDEALDQQFWSGVPAKNKLQVLLSREGYCVPAKNVGAFIDELLTKNDRATAEQVLRNYCALLRGDADDEIKTKIARGIASLSEHYARVSDRVLQWGIAVVASALSKTYQGDLGQALIKAMAALGRQAGTRASYSVVSDYFDQIAGLDSISSEVGGRLWAESGIDETTRRFVNEAVSALEPKPDLIDALRQIPQAVAEELKVRAAASSKREDYRRLTVLSKEVGKPVLQLLKQGAKKDKPGQALLAAGLLAPSDTLFVEEVLKARMPGWAPTEQSATIHQIACGGIPDRGVLLTQLFDSFHELILPQAIDEIGISGSADLEKLVEISGRQKQVSPFIQLKVIEALGNLRAKTAVPLLRHFVLARSVFKYEYARETRIVAMQAMLKIDPLAARDALLKSGLTSDELLLAPLKPGPGEWVRQRRYTRIPIDGSVWASIRSDAGSCELSVEAMSMGGGGGSMNARALVASDGMVEMQFGLRKVRARVLLHPIDTFKLGFEIASIPLEDRTRLRQFLTGRQRRA